MGFVLLIFNHNKWYDIYYKNCTLKTVEEWNAQGTSNVPMGVTYLTMGVISWLLYIPFLIAMAKPEFFQHSCYKFMFLLGVIDMFAIPCNAIMGGVQGILGLHYCSHPTLFYVIGTIAMAGWLMASCTCCILALDRFFEVTFPNIAKIIFGGKVFFIWLSLPFFYLFYYMFQIPVIYSNKYHAVYFDPFVGVPGFQGNEEFFKLTFLIINSVVNVGIMGTSYTALCIAVTIKRFYCKHLLSMTKLQRAMLLQSFAICFEMFFVSIVYVSNQWIEIPDFMTKIEHVIWICVHGDTPILYLLLNASLRKKLFEMLKEYTKKTGNTIKIFTYVTSIYPFPVQSRINEQKFWTVQENKCVLSTRHFRIFEIGKNYY